MSKPKRFRELLKLKRPVILAGSHDALSAKLIEEAGFDGAWASSFGISAATKCLPDANVLTMTETLEATKGMSEAISIPLIADCDNGYGNALNVIRMVKEYERAGIAGVSIEDNPFPKKCSLYPGERQDLVDKDEMAGRIHAAKSTQVSKDFFVIARTEALIAGLGMEEALSRAKAYEEAGADAILIHSRQPKPDEIREFAKRWKGIPLVAVPTKYPDITAEELYKMGIKIVIFANQALRASVRAMQETLSEIKKANSIADVDKKVVPLKEVFRLVGQPLMEEHEAKFVKNYKKKPSAIIVAAGFEKNIWPLNQDKPKAMLEIQGKTILERQVSALKKAGIHRIAVVKGYKKEKINSPEIISFTNPRYKETHILHSLFCAESEMQDKFLFMYGDVLFDDYVLEKLLKSKHDISLVVERSPKPEGHEERDWVSMDFETDQIKKIGHRLEAREANAEFIGIASFSKKGSKAFREAYSMLSIKHARNGHSRFHNSESFRKAQFTDLIQELINRKISVHAVSVRNHWLHIDSFRDYQEAWKQNF